MYVLHWVVEEGTVYTGILLWMVALSSFQAFSDVADCVIEDGSSE